VGSSYLFHALLHYINLVIPADVIQKTILIVTFVLAGWGAHRLIRYTQQAAYRQQNARSNYRNLGLVAGSCLYMINPFTYERLMAGQYAVLLGYALLPWFVHSLLTYVHKPSWAGASRITLLVTIISIVSIHTLGAVAIIVGIAAIGMLWRYGVRTTWQLYGRQMLGAMVAFALLSSYWLWPLLSGDSQTAQQISNFGSNDRLAFATSGETVIGKFIAILQLCGFWGEGHGLFTLPWDIFGPVWYLLSLLVLTIIAAGLVSLWRLRPVLSAFWLVVIGVGAICAVGVFAGSWPSQHSLLAGYREPQKFVMLVSLGYSISFAYGVAAVSASWSEVFSSRPARLTAGSISLALPFVWSLVMLWGANDQLAPRHYPEGWFKINNTLNRQASQSNPATPATVFLPWHLYMSTDFAGRLIANPAPDFFDSPVAISGNPELSGASVDKPTALNRQLDEILTKPAFRSHDHAPSAGTDPATALFKLQRLGIRNIILAKDNDFREYLPLVNQPGVTLAEQTNSINLYHLQPVQFTALTGVQL
jgi:hypothetical protein